jgi:hypothetical protein
MRSPFVFLILLIAVKAAAQQEPVMTWPEMKPFKKLPIELQAKPTSDSAERNLAILNSLYNKQWYNAGVQVDDVSMGKVYRMPIDNMPCIVPDVNKNARMPIRKSKSNDRMPNAFPMKRRP